MKFCSVLLAASFLASCAADGSLTPGAQKLASAACKIDAATQPVAVTLTPVPVQATDNLLVHPLVVQACAAIGGTPVAATTVPATATTQTATPVAAPVNTTVTKP